MEPTRDELIRVSVIAFGPVNKAQSNGRELRFGTHGSKSVDLEKRTFYDHETGKGGGWTDLWKLAREPMPRDDETPAVRRRGEAPPPWQRPRDQTYDYVDEYGAPLFQVVRFADGFEPRFMQLRPDGKKWVWNIDGVRRVLYRLPELLSAPDDAVIWLCEGEKDVDTAIGQGLHATTNPMGASIEARGKWLPEYSEALRGRDVALLPDNDDVGRSHMAAIARMLGGVARSVRTVVLPGLPPGGDVSDWLGLGNTVEDLERLYREAEAPPVAPTRALRASYLPDIPINFIPPRPWQYGNFLLTGHTAVLGARDGGGKGQIAVGMALSIISGQALLGEQVHRSGPVGIISYEDDRDEWHRRVAAGCLYHKVDINLVRPRLAFLDLPDRAVVLASLVEGKTLFPDGDEIVDTLREAGAVTFIIDPFNHAHQIPDGNSNVLIAQVARETDRIASASGTAGLVLHHLRKGASGEVDDLMGATSLRATFRSCRILSGMDEETAATFNLEEHWRYIRIASGKQNYSPPAERSFWYRLASVALPNGTDAYPQGDNVGVAERWTPPTPFEGLGWPAIIAVLGAIDQGLEDGWRYSPSRQAKRWAGLLLVEAGRSADQAAKILAAWTEEGVLRVEDFATPDSKTAKGLFVDRSKFQGMKNAQAAPTDDTDL